MDPDLARLKRKITDGAVPFSALLAISNPGEILLKREEQAFISEWKRVWRSMNLGPDGNLIAFADEATILEIGELVSKAALPLAPSIEFTNLISTDFDLIARSLASKRSDAWVNGLWSLYKSGTFPRGQIRHVEGALANLL